MDRPIDRRIKLAEKNICEGTREEPRIYYDRVPLELSTSGFTAINSDPNALVNGEEWPVRITRLIYSLGLDYQSTETIPLAANFGPPMPQQILQGLGARLRRGDEYYMNANFVAIPAWTNTVASSPTALANAGSSWTFDNPVVLSVRDYFDVQVQALADQIITSAFSTEPEPEDFVATITVSFTGVGLQSGMPYFLGGSVEVTDSVPAKIPPDQIRNVSGEPIVVTDMSIQARFAQPDESQFFRVADIRFFSVQCTQLQNGTRSKWFQGPVSPLPVSRMNGSLLGLTSGVSVVHILPGDGLQLEPGQGVRLDAQVLSPIPADLYSGSETVDLWVGCAGYAMVT